MASCEYFFKSIATSRNNTSTEATIANELHDGTWEVILDQ